MAADLPSPRAEGPDERSELPDLAGLGIEVEPVRGQDAPEVGVGGDGCVADPVDRLDTVSYSHGVDAAPGAGCPDPGVDLEVEVPVRVPGAGGVVPDHRRLKPLHRDLDLPAPRPHPGGRMLGHPAHDLGRRLILRCIQCG